MADVVDVVSANCECPGPQEEKPVLETEETSVLNISTVEKLPPWKRYLWRAFVRFTRPQYALGVGTFRSGKKVAALAVYKKLFGKVKLEFVTSREV